MTKKRHFLFVTIDGGGNLPPVFGIARRLKEKGHQVSFLTEPCLETPVQKMGMDCILFSEYFDRTDRREDLFRDAGPKRKKNAALDRVVFGPSQVLVENTNRALLSTNADVLVVDCLLLPAISAAEARKIPSVTIFHFPEYFPGPNRPPGTLGLLPGKSWLGKLRDRALGVVFHKTMNGYLDLINGSRNSLGLGPLNRTADLIDRVDLRLITTLKSFDFPIEPAAKNTRYTGPILDEPDWTGDWEDPWPADDTRPLVVVSLSTTFQDQQATIQRIINALDRLPVRGLVTVGPSMDMERFSVPENVILKATAPHAAIFPQADLVITHAGHGTIMRALANGLPLLCMPMGRDQSDNAAKIAYHGCGLSISPRSNEKKISLAITRLLKDAKYRNASRRFAIELEKAGPVLESSISELENIRKQGVTSQKILA